jgi:hypothetical protein
MKTSNEKWKTEVQVIVLNPFTLCSLCKWKFVICPFVYIQTKGSYPFANRLSGLNGLNRLDGLNRLVHLWIWYVTVAGHPVSFPRAPNRYRMHPTCHFPIFSFFRFVCRQGPGWYLAQFPPLKQDQLGIEKSPSYFVTPGMSRTPPNQVFFVCFLIGPFLKLYFIVFV